MWIYVTFQENERKRKTIRAVAVTEIVIFVVTNFPGKLFDSHQMIFLFNEDLVD